MKKVHTTYEVRLKSMNTVYIEKSETHGDHLSLYSVDPCDGILKHYGSKSALIAELKEYIIILENFK